MPYYIIMELWKQINNSQYEVSNTGKVREVGRVKLLRSRINKRGYYYVCLFIDGRYIQKEIHILVSRAFIGSPIKPKLPIKHLDNNKLNNNIDNLQYSTVKEMSQSYWRAEKGKTTPASIVRAIRAAFPNSTIAQLAIEYNLNYYTARDIIRGKRCKFY